MNLFQQILNWIFPRLCVGCGLEGCDICSDCLEKLDQEFEQQCPKCRRKNTNGRLCCSSDLAFDQLIVALPYDRDGVLKKLIVRLKYKFVREVADLLADILKKKLKCYFEKDPVVVPVPLDKNKLKKRGFNQAKVLAKKLGLEVWDCLERKFNPQRQADLGRAGRLKNMEGLFSVRENFNLSGRNIILIDDVATTCTTLNECSKVLKSAGVKHICGLVLGRGK